jgi:DNA-binding CsgD family transcriptional regulator
VAGIVGAGHTLVAHLVVRERIVSAVLLFRVRRRGAFTDAEAATLRRVAPAMALADALHQGLDAAPQRPVPTRLRCEDQRLTARQREIVELVAMGHTNAAIAAALAVSPNTLRNHLAEVFRRLGASNRADVVRLAVLA